MSKIQGKPFIEEVINTLGDELKSDFLDLVNGSDATPAFRSLINASHLITGADKNKVQYVVLETWNKAYTGYLIYNNSYCVLVSFTNNTQEMQIVKIDLAKQTYSLVKQPLSILELRMYLMEADEHIVATEIDSGDEPADRVLASDGDGGAEWKDVMDVITPETVESGDAIQLFGFNADGQLVKDDIPEGILVDETIIEDSPNAVAGGAVYDALADINAELEEKANVDGNYPTMTVGMADNLTPYDEESGDDQDEPFSFQATGTANGTQSDFATGSTALLREKQGNSVVVNQLAKVLNTTNWSDMLYVSTLSLSNGVLTATSNNANNRVGFGQHFSGVVGHKYLAIINITDATEGISLQANIRTSEGGAQNIDKGLNYKIFTYSSTTGNEFGCYSETGGESATFISCNLFKVIDLTQWFNGDIPQDLLDNPENFFRYYQGSLAYNAGELVNANGQYIKCIGRQQWDEEWEQGSYDGSTGEKISANRLRSKNKIKVIPNATYYLYCGVASNGTAYFYDVNNNFISSATITRQNTFTIPANAIYMAFNMFSEYGDGTTYNHDITISIYYEGESGYDQYYPYEVLTNNDTGTETLRSAGSVKDYKEPSGEITRRIASVDLSTLEWSKYADNKFSAHLSGAKSPLTSSIPFNGTCNKLIAVGTSVTLDPSKKEMSYGSGGTLYVANSDWSNTSDISGTLYYELAESTTEQGTAFSANLVIDDFGSMEFAGTNGVPQGNLIFYPVDYKAFIDTLYDYTEGTPSELVKQSERTSDKSAQATLDTALQNAIGGTLRQCLCVKETLNFEDTDFVDLGTLNWGYSTTYNWFRASVSWQGSGSNSIASKILCTKYKNVALSNNKDSNLSISLSGDGDVLQIYDTNYIDETTFKNAMKGVLLAYEKASE